MLGKRSFLICLQLCLQQLPNTFQQPGHFGFYRYDPNHQLRRQQTVIVTVGDEGEFFPTLYPYPNCGLNVAENYGFTTNHLNPDNPSRVVYFIKKREIPRGRPSANSRYRYQFTASRWPLVPTDPVTNVITNQLADPPMRRVYGVWTFYDMCEVFRSIYCENSAMQVISLVGFPNQGRRSNWHQCGVVEKLVRLCMSDRDANADNTHPSYVDTATRINAAFTRQISFHHFIYLFS